MLSLPFLSLGRPGHRDGARAIWSMEHGAAARDGMGPPGPWPHPNGPRPLAASACARRATAAGNPPSSLSRMAATMEQGVVWGAHVEGALFTTGLAANPPRLRALAEPLQPDPLPSSPDRISGPMADEEWCGGATWVHL
mgnify:CR=1 FL=1